MGQFLIVSKADRLADYCQIAQSYQVGFEYNDFYDPVVLSDEERLNGIWQQYDANAQLDKGTSVRIRVSKGSKPTQAPTVDNGDDND